MILKNNLKYLIKNMFCLNSLNIIIKWFNLIANWDF